MVTSVGNGGKYYTGFVGNLLGFPAVKEFWKSVKLSQWVWCETFFGTQCSSLLQVHAATIFLQETHQ